MENFSKLNSIKEMVEIKNLSREEILSEYQSLLNKYNDIELEHAFTIMDTSYLNKQERMQLLDRVKSILQETKAGDKEKLKEIIRLLEKIIYTYQ